MNAETIFLVEINYIVIIFLKNNHKRKTSAVWSLAENQSFKEVFCRRAPVHFCNILHVAQETDFCLCYPVHRVSVFIALAWFPMIEQRRTRKDTISVHMWSFPIGRDTATYFFTKWKSLFTMLHSICTWSSVTTRGTKKDRLLLKTKRWICYATNALSCFSKFQTGTKLLTLS